MFREFLSHVLVRRVDTHCRVHRLVGHHLRDCVAVSTRIGGRCTVFLLVFACGATRIQAEL